MNNLPPPPSNAAPYAPPPSQYNQYGPQQTPYSNPQQASLPPPPAHQNGGFSQGRPPPPNHRHSGHDRQQKSKMVVTRYPRPLQGRQQYPPPPAGTYAHVPPPPVGVAPYSQTSPSWSHPQPVYGQHPATHPPPPNYTLPPPPVNGYQAPPPPVHNAYAAYGQQPAAAYPPPPAQQAYPPPPPQANPYAPPAQLNTLAPPPPPHAHSGGNWQVPPPAQAPQISYSPAPSTGYYQVPSAPITPAQTGPSVPPPQPATILPFKKDRNDPTFYDGWDEGEFEYGGSLWIPQKGESAQDSLSLGQYIWTAPKQIVKAMTAKIGDAVEEATYEQKYVQLVVASRYYESPYEGEGPEFVHSFQRFKQKDSWEEQKNDPMYRIFTDAELHEHVIPANEVFQQVLDRPKEDEPDIAAELEANLTAYFKGTKGGSGKNIEAENLLASLGVTGSAKPVYATPFPAYNPPPEESSPASRKPMLVGRTGTVTPAVLNPGPFNPFKVSSTIARQRTPHTNGLSGTHPSSLRSTPQPQYPRPDHCPDDTPQRSPLGHPPDFCQPGQDLTHLPPPPNSVNSRSPSHPRLADPWAASNGHRDNTPSAHGTPAGFDYGGPAIHGSRPDSVQNTPRDQSHEFRKRRNDEPDHEQRKRSKPKIPADPAYSRRW